jgi:LPS-assembly protein
MSRRRARRGAFAAANSGTRSRPAPGTAALAAALALAGAWAASAQAPAPPAGAAPPASAPPAASEPAPDRIAFEFQVPAAKGGGAVTGTAGAVETGGESEVTLTGGVEIEYRDLTFRAERVVLHRETMTVEAEGDVVLDQASRRVGAARADFDLATETGTFWNASAFAEPDQYFTGQVLSKTGEQTFEVVDGVVTSCTGDPTPDWSFRVSKARVELGGYAHITNARMRLKQLPILYWPYMIWPAKTERSSGFLIPNVGYTRRRGAVLGLAYYQVMGPSADLTLHLDGWENRYAGAGAELRYAPAEGTKGDLFYQLLRDRDAGRNEARAVWRHATGRLPGGFRAVVDVNQYSDYEFFREFQRAERENTRLFLYSNAFLSGSWGPQSLSVVVDQRETFRTGAENSTQRQLPEISYRLRKLKLGAAPLYLSLDSTASWFETESPGEFDVSYGRFDLTPELTLPLRLAPWLQVALSAGGRATWWGESVPRAGIDPETSQSIRVCESGAVPTDQKYCGEELNRAVPRGEIEVVGPSFSKIFDSPGGRFSKFKHVIEPRLSYAYAEAFDDQDRVARFDEIDGTASANAGRAALVNRVLAKPSDATEGGAFEIFSFELAQNYSFEEDRPLQRSSDGTRTSDAGPLLATLRYSPARGVDFQGRASWSTLFSQLQSTSLSARAKGRRAGVDLTWYTDWNAETGERRSDQARFGFDLAIVRDRLSLNGQVNYDLEKSELLQHRYFLNYRSQCWSALLEFREQTTASFETQDFRFLLTLRNVGTFLDLNGGQSTDRY